MFRYFLFGLLFVAACGSDTQTVDTTDADGYRESYRVRRDNLAREGTYERFDPQGTLLERATYRNDTLDGERRLFRPDGSLEISERYADGRFAGPYRTYYPDGAVQQYGVYTDNAMNGEWTTFYPSGDTLEVVTFVDNQENGPFREYYENGNVKARGFYLDGDKEDGPLELYDENGELERRMTCDRGICRTVWTREDGDVTPAPLPDLSDVLPGES